MQYVATVGLSFILLVLVANLLVDLYARAAVRDALDEAVRAGATVGATTDDCETRADDVLRSLLRGPVGGDVSVRCARQGGKITATARGSLPSWLPMLLPPWELAFEASMPAEP
ncbi:MAG: hypothetical protein ACT4OX_08415 [Actinomycetota bacterium]